MFGVFGSVSLRDQLFEWHKIQLMIGSQRSITDPNWDTRKHRSYPVSIWDHTKFRGLPPVLDFAASYR